MLVAALDNATFIVGFSFFFFMTDMVSLVYRTWEHYRKHSVNRLQFFFYRELEHYASMQKCFSYLASISE